MQRAAELELGETEAVAELVGGVREFFETFAALGVEQIELFAAVREAAEGYAEEADFSFEIAVLSEELLGDAENVGVELGGFGERFGAGVGVEAGVADGEGDGAGGKAGFAETLAGFLRKMA